MVDGSLAPLTPELRLLPSNTPLIHSSSPFILYYVVIVVVFGFHLWPTEWGKIFLFPVISLKITYKD